MNTRTSTSPNRMTAVTLSCGVALAAVVTALHHAAGTPAGSTVRALAPLLMTLAVALWASRRGPRWRLLAGVVGLQCLLAIWPLLVGRTEDSRWVDQQEERARHRLDVAVVDERAEHAAFARFVTEAAAGINADSLTATDPFTLCAAWLDNWRRETASGDPTHLGVALWRGDQRLGWAGPVVPSHEPATLDAPILLHDDERWALRGVAAPAGLSPYVLECQLWLAGVEPRPLSSGVHLTGVQRSVVRDARATGVRRWGDADRGLRLVEDVELGPANQHGVRPRLRLSVQVPARGLLEDRRHAGLMLSQLLLAGVAVMLWTWAYLPGLVWLAAWVIRGWWTQVDLVRWLAATVPPDRLPAPPNSPLSWLDPAYFATTVGGGWFASGIDALVTAVLVAATAAWVWRRYGPRQLAPERSAGWSWHLSWLVPLLTLVLYGLVRLWSDIAANANARLIGLQVPLDAWTFWGLHAVILMISLAVGSLGVLLVLRLRGGLPRALVGRARPYWLAAGLLAAVLFNYFVLSNAYGNAERDWLRRKAEQIVQPQDEWIGFLVEDVLGDMIGFDATEDDPTTVGAGRGSLRRDQLAHRLWQRSSVRDLGISGLVEVLDAAGQTESLYASGFLRDFGYEIVARSDWWSLTDADGLGPGRDGVLLQDEVRRYPTGQERIMRGEVARADERGWLRLELPVQSLRINTLTRRLAGAQDVRTGSGYRPRLEVDRPLLLMRGDGERWLDTAFGDLPSPDAEPVLAALREGVREWADLEIEGHHWLCRWAPLRESMATVAGEGFLLGLQRRGAVEILLDVGRLLLLDVLLFGAWLAVRAVPARRWRWMPGFQGRFLLGYLVIGMVLLLIAGSLADRQTFRRVDQEARAQTRDGLVTALGQLRGLLAEQARALASSDYIADLLRGQMGDERRLGPIAVRQGMVFGPDGRLLLDETLSDLDQKSAAYLLEIARTAPLVVMQQPGGIYFGVVIPIDLAGVLEEPDAGGTFFYRQLVDDQLLPGLAEVIGGEVTLRLDGEVIDASHPGRVLDGGTPLLASPDLVRWYRDHPSQPRLQARALGLGFTGGISLPAMSASSTGTLVTRMLPAVLSVEFPDRERDFASQRRRMGLFLAGLITVLLLTAFGLAMALTWNIFEPLRVLLAATRQLAAGDYSAPLPPAGGDEVGRLSAGFHSMRDQLQNARQVLEAREHFLRVVLERVPVGVLVWDGAGKVAAWNPAACEILARFYPEVAIGKGHEADLEAWIRALRHDMTDRLADGVEELASPDGRRTLRVGQAPLELGAEVPHRLVVCEDLTDFLAAKKLALNAELARQVAHEIKNPLTPIQLSAQLVQQAYRDGHPRLDEIVEDAVRRILEQVALLRRIAGEFSLLGRPGELDLAAIDPVAVVDELVAGYRSELPDRGPYITVAAETIPPVMAHRESLLKVLGNLMQNSLDATGQPEALELSVSWRVDDGAVALIWADNGPGIAGNVAGRLFDPYFSTKSKGTGLGLAICRNLLDMMGGTIDLTNGDQGRGAVATVVLRRADAGDPLDSKQP